MGNVHLVVESTFHQIMSKSWVLQPSIGILREHLLTFQEFPPRQESASLDINKAINSILKSGARQ